MWCVESESEKVKADKIRSLLQGSGSTDLKELQSLSYSGLPVSVRGTTWKLLAVSQTIGHLLNLFFTFLKRLT